MWVALASSAWAQATPGYTMHQITYPNSFETFLFGVNDKGNMIGGAVTPGEFEERTLYFAKYGSAYVELEESFGLDCVRPHAINNHKHIIGLYCEPDDPPPYNFGLSFEHVRTSWTQIQVPGVEQTVVEGNNDGLFRTCRGSAHI
jgi:hypothetical protein